MYQPLYANYVHNKCHVSIVMVNYLRGIWYTTTYLI